MNLVFIGMRFMDKLSLDDPTFNATRKVGIFFFSSFCYKINPR